ncbi:MAG: CPBP family intramembrane metalloprotease, partial [Candidatus Eremiobacteraeota bacterium]|nr:CPBP family intramembrane metalloprotease [Candidatus Eremiobacteraeota bacterium]
SAVVSGALFAVAHQDPFLMIPLAAGGIILCYVYVRTGNAWMSMITHACFNGFTLAVLFIAPKSAF